MMVRFAVSFAALSGALGVLLGAFGAHALRDSVASRLLDAFQTGVQYQMLHSLALLAVAALIARYGRSLPFDISVFAFALGILMFSGSLYGLALTEASWLGPVTPVGGVCFVIGWLGLLAGGVSSID